MEKMQNDEIEIDLLELFYALKEKVFLILTVGLLCACLTCSYSLFFMKPVYTSTSTMLVLATEGESTTVGDLQMGNQLTNDYMVLLKSGVVLNEVIENLELETTYKELQETIEIENPAETHILKVSVKHNKPEKAQEIVNELVHVAADYIGEQMEVKAPKIIEEGALPTTKTSPSIFKNTILGLLIGLVLSAGLIVVRTVMDTSIKTEEDIEKYLGLFQHFSAPSSGVFIPFPTDSAVVHLQSGTHINEFLRPAFFPQGIIPLYMGNNRVILHQCQGIDTAFHLRIWCPWHEFY